VEFLSCYGRERERPEQVYQVVLSSSTYTLHSLLDVYSLKLCPKCETTELTGSFPKASMHGLLPSRVMELPIELTILRENNKTKKL
jgi:hypothetical protein